MAIKQVTAINKIFPRGEKTVAAIVELDAPSVVDDLTVQDRTITGAETNGSVITLLLDPNDEAALTRKMVGFGPDTQTKVTGANLSVKQKGSLRSVKCSNEIDEDIAAFRQFTYRTKDGNELIYHLYEPERNVGEKLPLVLFMHDSSVVSKDAVAPLVQGMGGVVWALQEEQEKRPCYVLVPAYQEKTAFDDFTVKWECEATAELIESLIVQYPIDEKRIYGTGQSMGCMMLYELLYRHSNLFTACYLVAGQWDIAKIAALKDRKLWILISEKDEKAWPIVSEGMRLIEDGGGKVARGHLDAKADAAAQKAFADAVLAQGAEIQFTWYEGESNVPDGMKPFPGCYHLCTWLWAYGVEPVREWLFRQSR